MSRKRDIFVRPMKDAGIVLNNAEEAFLYFKQRSNLFAKYILNTNLSWYQGRTIRKIMSVPYTLMVWGRGGGKTRTLATAAVELAMSKPEYKVGVYGPVKRQGDYIFNEIENLYRNSPYFQACTVGKIRRTMEKNIVQFVNGSFIESAPIGDGCLNGCSLVTYSDKISTIKDTNLNSITKRNVNIWGNGKFRISDESYDNGIKDTKIINTKKGYSIEGTHNHKIKIIENSKILWKRFDEIKIGDKCLIDRSKRWHNNNTTITEDEAYAIGFIIGDGNYLKSLKKYSIRVATKDYDIIKKLNKVKELNFVKTGDKVHFNSYGIKNTTKFLDKFGIKTDKKSIGKNKSIPDVILRSSKSIMKSFIMGLMDANGCVSLIKDRRQSKKYNSLVVTFSNTSKQLVDQLHYIFLHFGIVCTKTSRKRNKKWNNSYELNIYGNNVVKYFEEIGFYLNRKKLMFNPIYFLNKHNLSDGVPCKNLLIKLYENHINYFGKKGDKKVNRAIGLNRSNINSRKIITRNYIDKFINYYGSFKEHGDVIDHIKVLSDSNIFYDEIVSINHSQCHTYDCHVPEGNEYCANGFFSHNSKIRGARYQALFLDEYAQFDPSIIDLVIRPFLAIQLRNEPNKLIMSSSAYYKWNHLWEQYKLYKIQEVVNPDLYYVSEYDFRDTLIDPDKPFVFDVNIIKQAKEIMTDAEFRMEWLREFPDDADSFFPTKLIDDSTPKPPNIPIDIEFDSYIWEVDSNGKKVKRTGRNKDQYVMGVDVGRAEGGANFAIAICKYDPGTNVKSLVRMISRNGIRYQEMEKIIRQSCVDYNIVRIHCDKGGGGETIRDLLREPWEDSRTGVLYDPILDMEDDSTSDISGLRYLKLVNFHGNKHATLFSNLRAEMEHGRMLYPLHINRHENREIERANLEIKAVKSELAVIKPKPVGSSLKFEVPGSFRKDRAVGLTLAVDAALELHQPNWRLNDQEELPMGFWL